MTAGAASGNNRERRLAQSKGNPRRPNARIFLRIQSRCDLPQPGFLRAKLFAGKTHTSPTNGKNIRRATVSDLLHRSRNHRSAPTTRPALAPVCTTVAPQEPTGSEDTRQYRNATLHHVPAPVPFPVSHPSSGLQLRPPAPSGLRPDPSWDPTREPTAAGESRFSPRCSRSGRCCPAARGAAAWHARG